MASAKERIKIASDFSEWLHLDVSDGKFTSYISWGNPDELRLMRPKAKIEVHLMVINPDEVVESWLRAGAKRVIVHIESAKDPLKILELCHSYEAEAMLAVEPETPVEKLVPFARSFSFFQILDVYPGPSGQKFQVQSLDKLKFLRAQLPDATIEMDAGIDPATAKLCLDAGANILVAGSYIFENSDPQAAFSELSTIV